MNRRSYEILILLYDRPGEFSFLDLSQRMQISVRTIREDIRFLNDFLQQKNLPLIEIKGGRLSLSPEIRLSGILQQLNFYEYTLSRKERIIVESILLVCAEHAITLSQMADVLYVSRSTVIADLDSLNRFLKPYELEAVGQPNIGILMQGEEEKIRLLYIDIVETYGYLLKMFHNNALATDHDAVRYVKEGSIILQNLIHEVENEHHVSLTEGAYHTLIQYMLFAMYRMKNGKYISNYAAHQSDFMDRLFTLICQYFEIQFCEQELFLLSDLEKRLRFYRNENINQNVIRVQYVTRQFIECISKEINLPLFQDYNFFESLSLHLQRIFSKGITDLVEYSEVRVIVEKNEWIHRVVKSNVAIIEQHLDRKMTKGEISYIVVYVCAAIEKLEMADYRSIRVLLICNSGIGTSQLIRTKLEEKFNFVIQGVLPSHRIQETRWDHIDFIISTVDLNVHNVPYVKVSPLINDQDYLRLKTAAKELISKERVELSRLDTLMKSIHPLVHGYEGLSKEIERTISNYFSSQITEYGIEDYLTEEFITLDISCSDWKDAVAKASQTLLDKGYIQQQYIDRMIQMIEENGPYMVLAQGFALPHAQITDGVYRTGFCLARLKEPVSFHAGILDPIRYVCVLSAKDNKTHLNAFFELVNLLQINHFKKALDQANTGYEIVEAIKHHKKYLKTER